MAEPLVRLQAALAGRYAIERELGQGGMATVYLAQDLKHRRPVAMKVLKPEVATALGPERFLREIEVAARLNHPHILALHDSGDVDGFVYFVMPYVEGESLRQRLLREKQLALDEALQIAGAVASALTYAHDHGVVHRDIKPENILLSGDEAVVADFGIARPITAAGGDKLTMTGVAVGTPTYMSPEQAAGDAQLDGRSDVYSLGCVLYEMLAGEPPFTGPNAHAVIAKRMSEPVPHVGTLRDVPAFVEQAVTRALARVPADRFATAAEFAETLSRSSMETRTGRRAVTGDEKSVAVLPFANLSADAENEYFSDGMTEEIINALGQVPGLRVAARTSSFAFKDKGADLRAIAEGLNVRSLVEGSVRKAGNRIRITAQLINAADGYHVWSERYDRTLDDVFAVQDEIARAIVDKLTVRLGAEVSSPLVRRPTQDIEAYELYLQGRYFWVQGGTGLLKGLRCFEAALAKDPNYALAHAGVADAYNVLSFYGYLRPHDAISKARAAAARALALDPTLAEAHCALGYILGSYDWDGPRAATEFRKAIELKPGYLPAWHWYAAHCRALNRLAEAVAVDEEAVRIDPLSVFAHMHLGWMLLLADRVEEAIGRLVHALDLDANFLPAHWLLGRAYLAQERSGEAIAELEKAVELSARLPWMVANLGMALASLGRPASARQILDELCARSEREYVPARCIALLHAYLGNVDTAFEWLEKAREERDPWLPFPEHRGGRALLWIPEQIWNDPRWTAFKERLGVKLE